ncbi:unnamed protein product [Vitrella brassicaformis CCMP3155]|uniref:Uncharacterized protein n=1 Tax=Vitrella brassicaformis (strain CCMP3155) TaxID=1169540 RepID=A0A0G4EPR7_VITBC|nr:unnamed protein product [Vitrella brassicaformis CCMP3155]|eukprot:CEL99824.1 unnamed protein product [Vitrella brassicaformis CCMP3155]
MQDVLTATEAATVLDEFRKATSGGPVRWFLGFVLWLQGIHTASIAAAIADASESDAAAVERDNTSTDTNKDNRKPADGRRGSKASTIAPQGSAESFNHHQTSFSSQQVSFRHVDTEDQHQLETERQHEAKALVDLAILKALEAVYRAAAIETAKTVVAAAVEASLRRTAKAAVEAIIQSALVKSAVVHDTSSTQVTHEVAQKVTQLHEPTAHVRVFRRTVGYVVYPPVVSGLSCLAPRLVKVTTMPDVCKAPFLRQMSRTTITYPAVVTVAAGDLQDPHL